VTFLDGSKVLKTVTVAAGKASYTTAALSDAKHTLKATFAPTDSSVYATSSSPAHTLTVKAHATKTTLKASKAKIAKGKKLSLSATVAPAVAGKVTFLDGSKKLTTVAVKKGRAEFSVTTLKVGTHKLTATFTPTNTANDGRSTSKTVKVKVTK
jgi:5'-nucleotidase